MTCGAPPRELVAFASIVLVLVVLAALACVARARGVDLHPAGIVSGWGEGIGTAVDAVRDAVVLGVKAILATAAGVLFALLVVLIGLPVFLVLAAAHGIVALFSGGCCYHHIPYYGFHRHDDF